ncbi:MAG: cytochrome c maturation protein CcmE [OCS116 cluster bacterium]|uniref:Cytochrome c-type biogenesis protein CcmE n=1 Tax=OCS116 cluster bacterium TaxID=2030921 RepID=A0A2A4ZA33_9PROT|nr:cytochrome c maturation protein CcmE [OCS116 cluster bacterium]
MTRKQQRFTFIIVGLALLGLATGLILVAMEDGISFFKTPTEILTEKTDSQKRLRIGGLVMDDTVKHEGLLLKFIITDNQSELNVEYEGVVPDLFKEGQGVVLEGYLSQDKIFLADSLLAKHDENYMPKEVADSLKAQGHWQDADQKVSE